MLNVNKTVRPPKPPTAKDEHPAARATSPRRRRRRQCWRTATLRKWRWTARPLRKRRRRPKRRRRRRKPPRRGLSTEHPFRYVGIRREAT